MTRHPRTQSVHWASVFDESDTTRLGIAYRFNSIVGHTVGAHEMNVALEILNTGISTLEHFFLNLLETLQ